MMAHKKSKERNDGRLEFRLPSAMEHAFSEAAAREGGSGEVLRRLVASYVRRAQSKGRAA